MSSSNAGNLITAARILQPHALLYIIGFVLYLIMNFVALIFDTLFKGSCQGFCCCCFTGKSVSKGLKAYSNNLYGELSIEDLKAEYMKTKTEVQDFRTMVS